MAKTAAVPAWTDEEIILHYRQAADKHGIIEILADLNAVSKERIRAILKRGGINPPTKRTKKKSVYKANHYYYEASDGVRYTTGQLARKTGHAQSYIWNRAHASTEVTIDGEVYRVIKIAKGSTKGGNE